MYNVTEKQIKVDNRIQGAALAFVFLLFLGMMAGYLVMLVSSALNYEPNELTTPIAVKLVYASYAVGGLLMLLFCVFCVYVVVNGIRAALYVYVFDQLGVSRVSLFGQKHIPWENVKDYGVSFKHTRRTRHGINIGRAYTLYVSDKACPTKSSNKKDLSGVFFRLSFSLGYQRDMGYFAARRQGEYERQMLAFCAEHTDVEPFIASNATGLLDPVLESPSDKLKEKFRSKK